MALDVRTLLIVLVVSNLLMAATLLLVFARKLRDGLGYWAVSLGVQALAWVLFAGRGAISDVLSIVVANALLPVSWSLQVVALCQFQRRRASLWIMVLPGALTFTWFLVYLHEFQVRMMVGNLLLALASLATAHWTLRFRVGAELRTRWLLIGSYLVTGAVFLSRSLVAWLTPHSITSFLAPGPVQSMTFLLGYALVIINSFGYLLMHKERADRSMRQLALTDPLTGALNRRTFLPFAERELARFRERQAPVSLLMLDLDHFKRINDGYGHRVGDEVLTRFVARVQTCLRQEDKLVRYGGEEFCLLLPGAGQQAAEALAERIRVSVAESPFMIEGHELRVTVSIGVATVRSDATDTLQTLVDRADSALYRAKKDGRSRVAASAPVAPVITRLPVAQVAR